MLARDIVKEIMAEKGIKNADMASALGVSQATLWDRLNNKKTSNMSVGKLNEMLRYLGYEVVIMPRGKANRIDGAKIAEDLT